MVQFYPAKSTTPNVKTDKLGFKALVLVANPQQSNARPARGEKLLLWIFQEGMGFFALFN